MGLYSDGCKLQLDRSAKGYNSKAVILVVILVLDEHIAYTLLIMQTLCCMLEVFSKPLGTAYLEQSDILPLDRGDELDPEVSAQEAHLFSIPPMCDPDLTVACPWCMQSAVNAFLGDCMLQPILMCLFILSTPSLSPTAGAQNNHFDYEND